jgi:hypothetical protein
MGSSTNNIAKAPLTFKVYGGTSLTNEVTLLFLLTVALVSSSTDTRAVIVAMMYRPLRYDVPFRRYRATHLSHSCAGQISPIPAILMSHDTKACVAVYVMNSTSTSTTVVVHSTRSFQWFRVPNAENARTILKKWESFFRANTL